MSLIITSVVLGLIVIVIGLLALSLVTGKSLQNVFADTQMMQVFFVTGVGLAVVSYLVALSTLCEKCKK